MKTYNNNKTNLMYKKIQQCVLFTKRYAALALRAKRKTSREAPPVTHFPKTLSQLPESASLKGGVYSCTRGKERDVAS